MNFILSLILSLSFVSCPDDNTLDKPSNGGSVNKDQIHIVPFPQFVSYRDGDSKFGHNFTVSYSQGFEKEVDKFKDIMHSDYSVDVSSNNGNDADIVFEKVDVLNGKHADEYSLEVFGNKIVVKTISKKGVFYSMQSIRQMLNKEDDAFTVQNLLIVDYPDNDWRGVMLDEGRYFKGKESVKKILYEMSRLKMEQFHWHLTDDQGWRIEIKKYPKLIEVGSKRDNSQINDGNDWSWVHNKWDGVPHEGHYTQDDIKEIIEYASNFHIDVISEIEILTHYSAAIASYPWLGTTGKQIDVPFNLGVFSEVLNIGDERVVQFVDDVLDEVADLFPSEYIHVGGDELMGRNWEESKDIRSLKSELSLTTDPELQLWYFNKISHYLAAKGKRMIAWRDFIGKPDVSSKQEIDVADGTIAQFWQGDIKDLNYCLRNGLEVIQSHTNFAYFNAWMPDAYSKNVIPDGVSTEHKNQIIGLEACSWSEFDATVDDTEDHIFPRIAAYAESSWLKPYKKDYKKFLSSLNSLYNIWEKGEINVGGSEEST